MRPGGGVPVLGLGVVALMVAASVPRRAIAQLRVLEEERARSVSLGNTREPRIYLDTASIQLLEGAIYRARFRLEYSRTLQLPGGLEGYYIREIHEKEIDCAKGWYRPTTRILYDVAHKQVARADAAQLTDWVQPLQQSYAEIEVRSFCNSRWRTAKSD